jgi:predicted transcriptional regulator
MGSITHKETHRIKYQMALKGITQSAIAKYAGCTQPMVSQVLHGGKQSKKVQKVLASSLGYESFDRLLDEMEA